MASYSPVYSAQFILYSGTTPNETFDVPSSFTAVIRQITVNTGAGEVVWACYIQNDPLAPGIVIDAGEVIGINQAYASDRHVVVPGGGVITWQNISVGIEATAYVGGYLLRNVAA